MWRLRNDPALQSGLDLDGARRLVFSRRSQAAVNRSGRCGAADHQDVASTRTFDAAADEQHEHAANSIDRCSDTKQTHRQRLSSQPSTKNTTSL